MLVDVLAAFVLFTNSTYGYWIMEPALYAVRDVYAAAVKQMDEEAPLWLMAADYVMPSPTWSPETNVPARIRHPVLGCDQDRRMSEARINGRRAGCPVDVGFEGGLFVDSDIRRIVRSASAALLLELLTVESITTGRPDRATIDSIPDEGGLLNEIIAMTRLDIPSEYSVYTRARILDVPAAHVVVEGGGQNPSYRIYVSFPGQRPMDRTTEINKWLRGG